METEDKIQLSIVLRNYKLPNGAVNFPAVMSIPSEDRIWGLLSKIGYPEVLKTLVGAIQVAMENLNLAKPLTAHQIVDLAEILIESATEDNLGIEDVILFLQKLVRGESGKLFNQMDTATFMRLFEAYREERHQECMRIREEQNAHHKSLPAPDRISSKRGQDENYFTDAWKAIGRSNLQSEISKAQKVIREEQQEIESRKPKSE